MLSFILMKMLIGISSMDMRCICHSIKLKTCKKLLISLDLFIMTIETKLKLKKVYEESLMINSNILSFKIKSTKSRKKGYSIG